MFAGGGHSFESYRAAVATNLSSLEQRTIKESDLPKDQVRELFDSGVSAKDAANRLFEAERNHSRSEDESQYESNAKTQHTDATRKFPVGSILAAGIAIWICGGVFGLPLGPFYVSPEKIEQKKKEDEEFKKNWDAEVKLQQDAEKLKAEIDSELQKPTTHLEFTERPSSKSGRNGKRSISGSLRNKGSVKLTMARIAFPLYNAQGERVGETSDWIRDLGPGETWRFSADIFDESATKFGDPDLGISL
jgi:hypothetical protein